MMGGIPMYLISAAAGYWILTLSLKEKANVKKLGQLLALIIMVLSIGGAACKVYYLTACGPYGMKSGYCPVGKVRPFSMKAAPQQSGAQQQ